MRSQAFSVLVSSFLAFVGCMAPGTTSAGVPTFPFVFGVPASSNFQSPGIGVGGTPNIVTITLNPNGQTTIGGKLVNISFSGANAADFAIVPGGTCIPGTTVLRPITTTTGQSCTVNVRYTPSTNSVENGLLQVTCQAIALIGGFSVTCNVAGATGTVAALVGAIAAFLPVPALNPWMTTLLALLILAMGTFIAMGRSPRR
jgi:hypothetical protein